MQAAFGAVTVARMRRRGTAAASLVGMLAFLVSAAPAPALQFQSPPLRLTQVGTDGDVQRSPMNPAVAYAPTSGGRFLLVYRADAGATNDEQEIWCRLLDASATPLGPATRLSFTGTDDLAGPAADFPAVDFNPVSGEFMVVWQELDNEPAEDEIEVWLARVGTDGTPVDIDGGGGDLAVRVSDTEGGFLDFSGTPDIAVNPSNGQALVAFYDNRSEMPVDAHDDIRIQLLDAAGAQIPDAGDDRISGQAGPGESGAPGVAFNSELGQFGVVWDETNAGGYFQALDAAGAQVGPDDVQYFPGVAHGGPAIASAGAGGWQIAAQTAAGVVSVLRIDAAGVTGSLSAGLTASGSNAAISRDPLGGGFLIAGTGNGPSAAELTAAGIVSGSPVPAGTIGAAASSGNPAVAYDTTARRWLLVSAGRATATSDIEIFGAFTGAAGPPAPTPPPSAPPPAPAPAPTPAPQPKPAAAPALTSLATLPSTTKCVSRRSFRIRLREPKGVQIAEARVFVNGRRAKTVKGVRTTANVDLRGLPKGRFTVRIELRTADGRKITGTRRYRTCAVKRKGGSGPKV